MAQPKSLPIPAPMTGMNSSKNLRTVRPCWNRNARLWVPPREVAWPSWSRKAQPFFKPLSSAANPTARLTAQLLRLLDDYGAAELAATLREALDRHTPRLSSVAFILARRHRQRRQRPPLPVNLSRRPDLENLTVANPSLEAYDELTQDPDEEPQTEP